MFCRPVKTNPDDVKNPVKISIPRYVLCGQGKDEHYEYEIKVRYLNIFIFVGMHYLSTYGIFACFLSSYGKGSVWKTKSELDCNI